MRNLLKFRRFLSTTNSIVGKHKHQRLISVETEIYSPYIKNEIYYRGYSVHELASKKKFLDTFYLLLNTDLPSTNQNLEFVNKVVCGIKSVPSVMKKHNKLFSLNTNICDYLTSSWSLMNQIYDMKYDTDYGYIFGQCLGILWLRYLNIIKYNFGSNDPFLKFSAYLLFNKHHDEIDEKYIKILNSIFTLYMDHGLTSASYNCRVCVSEGGSTYSGLISAAATHKYVMDTLDSYFVFDQMNDEQIDSLVSVYNKENTLKYPLDEITFHRFDPRSRILTDICKQEYGEDVFYKLTNLQNLLSNRLFFKFDVYVFELIKRLYHTILTNKKDRMSNSNDINSSNDTSSSNGDNNNLYESSVIHKELKDKVSVVLIMSRIAGWLSQICEQRKMGRRIEHIAAYVGLPPRGKIK